MDSSSTKLHQQGSDNGSGSGGGGGSSSSISWGEWLVGGADLAGGALGDLVVVKAPRGVKRIGVVLLCAGSAVVVTGQVGTLARGADVIPVLAAARKRVFYELSLCLSRACHGKTIICKTWKRNPGVLFFLPGRTWFVAGVVVLTTLAQAAAALGR
jgi:hypothetical protein